MESGRIRVNVDVCAGCRYCELTCSFRKNGNFNPRTARIRVLKIDEAGVDTPVFCRQCDACPCVDACPSQAFLRDCNGIVRIDAETCTACNKCVDECTEDAVFRPPTRGKPLVCDTCDGTPACVSKCPTHALTFEANHVLWREKSAKMPDPNIGAGP